MASLFDAQIPPWMIDRKQPIEYMAEGIEAGSKIAHGLLAAKSLEMQGEQQVADVGHVLADTEMKKAQLQEYNQENSAWLNKDVKTVPKWMMTPLGELDTTVTPEVTSQRGMAIVQKRQQVEEQFNLRDAQNKATNEMRKSRFELDKTKADNAMGTEAALSAGDKDFVKGLELLDGNQRLAILGPEPKQPHFTPTQWARLQDALKAKGLTLPSVTTKTGSTDVRRNVEYLKELRAAGDDETAQMVENILKSRGHLGVDKLTGEDATKEKDLTKQIQVLEKTLNDKRLDKNAKPADLIPIQEQLLNAQSQRHKLYLKHAAPSSTAARVAAPATTPAPAQAAAPAASSAPAQIFTDKSGKKFKYRGSMTDPAKDKDPNNWELAE